MTTELPQTTAQPETSTVHSTAAESRPILLCCLVRLLCAEHCSIAGGLDSARYQKGTFYENASNQRFLLAGAFRIACRGWKSGDPNPTNSLRKTPQHNVEKTRRIHRGPHEPARAGGVGGGSARQQKEMRDTRTARFDSRTCLMCVSRPFWCMATTHICTKCARRTGPWGPPSESAATTTPAEPATGADNCTRIHPTGSCNSFT